jgi:hypothetical protein
VFFLFSFEASHKQALLSLTENRETMRKHGFSGFGGERGIRTPGPVDTEQRFSRPPHSTTLPFLRRKDNIFLFF